MSGPDLVLVGGGPRALQALVSLDDQLAEVGAGGLVVEVHDPSPLGTGAVWSPDQARHLLTPFDATPVDFSSRSGLIPYSYREWEERGGHVAVSHPPRARVGEYLSWAFEGVRDSPRMSVVHVAERVQEVHRVVGGWRVVGDSGSVVETPEVLLCTGQVGGSGPDHAALAADRAGSGPGRRVVVRGSGLTAMDVVLTLTAGRGSRWREARTPSGREWVGSGEEPARITMVTGTDELMMPRPEVHDPAVAAAVAAVARRWRPGSSPDDAWWTILVDAAVSAAAAKARVVERGAAAMVLDEGRGRGSWRARWALDLARARGEYADHPDARDEAAWWLGRAWAVGQVPLIASLERTHQAEDEWARWRSRSGRLRRWAFGPPEETVRRLLALGEAGVLEVAETDPDDAELDIDAVTAPPGVREEIWSSVPDALWAQLVNDGHVSIRHGDRGVWTREDGLCVRADGEVSVGLSAVGSPTEDPVIGHDIWLRKLHQDVDRWAEAFARRTSGAPDAEPDAEPDAQQDAAPGGHGADPST